MYLALFLTPWVLMYAFSSLVFNHFATIRGWYGGDLNQFEKVDEFAYQADFADDVTAADAARQILIDLDMDGAHFVRSSLQDEAFTIMRQSPFAVRRVTYYAKRGTVVVEKQVATAPNLLTRMHTRHGFVQPYASMKLWGLGVEIAVLAMLFWIASGIWLWWTIKPARMWGGICALGGIGLFGLLMFSI
jgi:hypothetical protein